MSLGLSDDEKQRLVELKNKNVNGVVDCGRLRDRYKRGDSVEFLAGENDVIEESVKHHLRGECACSSEVGALQMRGCGASQRPMCPQEGCRVWKGSYDGLTEHIRNDHGGDE